MGYTDSEVSQPLSEDSAVIRHAKSQAALMDFLRADLDLGFTMLRTAAIDAKDNPEHCRSALAKIRVALDTIRNLERRIEDPQGYAEVHSRADQLESALNGFSD